MNFTKEKYGKCKGFTIVELVVVISVIGILSAVMLPTFANLISKSKLVRKHADFNSSYIQYFSAENENSLAKENIYFYDGEAFYKFDGNSYLLVLDDSGKCLTLDNADEFGLVFTDYTFNNISLYYLDTEISDSEVIPPMGDNLDSENTEGDNHPDEVLETEEQRFEKFNDFLSSFENIDYTFVVIGFKPEPDIELYTIYYVSYSDGEFTFELDADYTLADLTEEGYELLESDTSKNIYIFTI